MANDMQQAQELNSARSSSSLADKDAPPEPVTVDLSMSMPDTERGKKKSVQERMLELRKRKHEREMEKKELQAAAGMTVRSNDAPMVMQMPVGAMKNKDKEPPLPEYTSVDRWEEYFAELAMAAVDGVVLSHAEQAMLRVHSAYSMALEEVKAQSAAPPQMWSVDDVDIYIQRLQKSKRQLTEVEKGAMEMGQIYSAAFKTKQNTIDELEEECIALRVQLRDPLAQLASPEDQPTTPLFGGHKRAMKEDVVDELKKELAVADGDHKRMEKRLLKAQEAVVKTRGNTMLNTVRAAYFVMLERGYRVWVTWWLRSTIKKGFSEELAEYARAGNDNEEDSCAFPKSPVSPNDVEVAVSSVQSPPTSPSHGLRPGWGRYEGDEDDIQESTQPQFRGQWKRLYETSMQAIYKADKARMNRMARGLDSESDEDHVASDDELETYLKTSEAGAFGILIGYTANLTSENKKAKWMRAFQRMYGAWHAASIARCAWCFGVWRALRLREQHSHRGQELTALKETHVEVSQNLMDMSEKFEEFRVGRVGTYIVTDKNDIEEDKTIDDDYSQLVAYTRQMNQNWSRERLIRGVSAAGWVLGRNFWNHLCARFYTWRQNTMKLKMLTQKFSLYELDKMELQAEATQAVEVLEDQQDANKSLEDTVARLKRELAKLRREKAWIERYAGKT